MRFACALIMTLSFLHPSWVCAARAQPSWPVPDWPRAEPEKLGLDTSKLDEGLKYALTGGGSGMVVVGGHVVASWGDLRQTYDLKSTTKSIGVTALGLAIKDGKLRLSDKAANHHPTLGIPPESNRQTGWVEAITIEHLARQTAGFEKPGGYGKLLFAPGTRWHYSDAGPNWLAECITLSYEKDVNQLMFERVFTPLGIKSTDLRWRKNSYRAQQINGVERREFGSGIHANADAMARIGYLYLRGGQWLDQEIIPKAFVEAVRATPTEMAGLPVQEPENYGKASNHYGLLWWNNCDGALAGVPRDAYWSWGLYDSLIVVVPSLDLVISRAGNPWKRESKDHYAVLKPFLEPIVAAFRPGQAEKARPASAEAHSAYPQSPVIRSVTWAPAETILRQARDSDNWPLTWADDDYLYTAYGDGTGFDPKVPTKLSLGLARVSGSPDNFKGENVRSADLEQKGEGKNGKKASGLLMVRGVLYMWVRNTTNSQLAWSADHGKTWNWSDWKFTTSFGCPTFLNFGKNYAGARDEFVYVYSPDAETAYDAADGMVLARVPADRITQRNAYEFFEHLDGSHAPVWTRTIEDRGGVFVSPGKCGRGSITYNPALKRYLWVQTQSGDARYRGGFGIYDAPEPWGPWTTVYNTDLWDLGPGETASFPTKWMSADGLTIHLVFSGNDSFSVRRAILTVAE